jgi:FMN phosphatase YigB (HAD superfamily)
LVLYLGFITAKKLFMIRAVFFDVGETLVDESRQWRLWADWLGVSHLTFFAAFGAVLERGEHHRRVFNFFAPNIDLEQASRDREAAGVGYKIELQDFYPDALPCLTSLSKRGYMVGIAGNQPESAEAALRLCGVSADFIASSAGWGIEKPSLRFFKKIVEETSLEPNQIAYVGDRLDNDILPAIEAGLFTVFLERGPWGILHARKPESAKANLRIKSLAELPGIFLAGGRCQ